MTTLTPDQVAALTAIASDPRLGDPTTALMADVLADRLRSDFPAIGDADLGRLLCVVMSFLRTTLDAIADDGPPDADAVLAVFVPVMSVAAERLTRLERMP